MKKKYNWELLYLCWLKKNLEGDLAKPYTYQDLGKEHKISHKTIRNHAAKEKWQGKLAQEQARIEQEIITTIQSSQITSEAKVRQRQAFDSRKLLDKAMAKLNAVKPEELTVKQAIELAKLGLTEERKALGLPDRYEVRNMNQAISGAISVEDRIKRHDRLDSLANSLFEYLNKQNPEVAKCN
jgi:hypothetical protein